MRADHWHPVERERWCYEHCRNRLMARYRLGLSWTEYRRLCALLAYGVRDPVAYSWQRREILILWHGGRPTKAVFCPVEGLIITFLPWQSYERYWYDPHAKHRDRKKRRRGIRQRKLSRKEARKLGWLE